MAVDTASKRYSMINFGSPVVSPLIIPDTSVDDGDRYHFLNLYFGISLGGGPSTTILNFERGFNRGMFRGMKF